MVKQWRKSILKSFVFLVLIFNLISCNAQKTEHIHNLTLEQLKTEVIGKDVQLVDVRTPKEYKAGHIDDAININIYNRETFTTKVKQLNKQAPIYVYCHIGGRSGKASKILDELGFKNIYDFSGGWKAWKKDQKIK